MRLISSAGNELQGYRASFAESQMQTHIKIQILIWKVLKFPMGNTQWRGKASQRDKLGVSMKIYCGEKSPADLHTLCARTVVQFAAGLFTDGLYYSR